MNLLTALYVAHAILEQILTIMVSWTEPYHTNTKYQWH